MSRRLALLVATYLYQDAGLRQLTAPGHDAEALAQVLRDPEIADFEVTILVNEPHHVVGDAIGEFYHNRRRDDLALLYFTGHGLKDDQGRLYLAMTNTKRDRLLFTGLSAQQIDDAMESCSSRQKVLVLDCCYSGAFPAGSVAKTDPQVNTLEKFHGKGRVVLTASDATQYSFEGNHITGEGIRSVFTRFLVDGLTTGEADLDGDGDIALDELYSYVHDRVIAEMPQQRPKKQENVEGRIIIARNIHWSLPAYVRNAIESPVTRDRLAALEVLAHLHRVGNDLVQAKALDQIHHLTHDDSKTVSAAATTLLTALNPDQAQRDTEEPPWAPAVSPNPRHVPAEAHNERQAVTSPPLSHTTARSSQPHLEAGADQHHSHTEVITQKQPSHYARRQPEGQDAPGTQTGRPTGLLSSWSRGRLTRRQMSLAVASALAVILLVVALVVVSTYFMTTTPSVTATIPVGTAPTPSVTATIPVGTQPVGVAVAPDGHHAYVTNQGSTTVLVIDTGTNTVTSAIPVGTNPDDVAVAPDGHHAYVTNQGSSTVSVIDTTTNTVTAAIPVGTDPVGVAVTPDGHHAYVPNYYSNTVSVIDTTTNTVTATIPVGTNPEVVAVTPDSHHAYVTNHGSNTVSVIDTTTNTVTAAIPVGTDPVGVAVTPDGHHAYVPNRGSSTVSVIDTTTNTVTATIPVGTNPAVVAVTPDGHHAYVTNNGSSTVSVIDTTTNTVTATIPVGTGPVGVAVTPDGHHAYVTNKGSNTVSVIEVGTG